MCGIAGWILPSASKWRPRTELVKYWLEAQEPRGKDASGYATITDDEQRLWYMKANIKASDFVKEFDKPTPIGHVGLLHARSWTVGSPEKNINNHPIVVGKCAVTHNGGLEDIEKVYEKLNITPPEEVDSAVIPYAFEALGYKKGLEILTELTPGAATIAAILSNGNLLIARAGRPLYIGRLPEGGFMWSSEPEVCFAADQFSMEPRMGFRGTARFPNERFCVIDRHTLKVIDSGDFKLKDPFVSSRFTRGFASICGWGNCMKEGKTCITDVDKQPTWLCKEHRKQWKKGAPVPVYITGDV